MYSSSAEYWLCHLFPNRWLFTRICRKFAYVAKCAIPQAPFSKGKGVDIIFQPGCTIYIHSVRSKRSKVFFSQIGFGPESSLHKKEINSMLKRTVDCIVRGEGNTKQPRPHSTSTTLPPNPPGTPVSQPNPPGTPVSQCETPPAAVVSNLIRFALSALQPQWHPHTFIFC